MSRFTHLDLYSEFTAKIPSKFGGGYGIEVEWQEGGGGGGRHILTWCPKIQ